MNTGPWEITARGVGEVILGRPLPNALRGESLGAGYFARYVADFQPEEGFRFADPPLEVVLGNGPFARAARTEMSEPDPARFRAAAVKSAAAGATVAAVRVVGAGPRTLAGIGVGSTLAALKAAYPESRVSPVPPTLGKDECVAMTPAAANVVFVFGSCADAEAGGAIIRIDVRAP